MRGIGPSTFELEGRESLWSSPLFLACLLGLVFVVRLIVGGWLLFPDDPMRALGADGWGKVAWNLIQGHGYVVNAGEELNITKNPIPVLFFAGIFWLFGQEIWPVLIGNWLLDVGTAYFLFRIARLLAPRSPAVAVFAVAGFAFYVPGIDATMTAMSEPVFTLFLAAHMYWLLLLLRSPTLRNGLICGLFLGAAVMCRSTVQMWLPVVWILLLVPPAWLGLKRSIKGANVIVTIAALTLSYVTAVVPWAVRNYLAFDHVILSSAPLGHLLYKNTVLLDQPGIPQVAGLEREMDILFRAELERRGLAYPEDGSERADLQKQFALEMIAERPGRFLELTGYQFIRLWFNLGYGTPASMQSYMVAAMHAVIMVAAFLSFALAAGPWRIAAIPIVLLIGYFTGVHVLTHSIVRYVIPIVPYLIVFSAIGVVSFSERWLGQSARAAVTRFNAA